MHIIISLHYISTLYLYIFVYTICTLLWNIRHICVGTTHSFKKGWSLSWAPCLSEFFDWLSCFFQLRNSNKTGLTTFFCTLLRLIPTPYESLFFGQSLSFGSFWMPKTFFLRFVVVNLKINGFKKIRQWDVITDHFFLHHLATPKLNIFRFFFHWTSKFGYGLDAQNYGNTTTDLVR